MLISPDDDLLAFEYFFAGFSLQNYELIKGKLPSPQPLTENTFCCQMPELGMYTEIIARSMIGNVQKKATAIFVIATNENGAEKALMQYLDEEIGFMESRLRGMKKARASIDAY